MPIVHPWSAGSGRTMEQRQNSQKSFMGSIPELGSVQGSGFVFSGVTGSHKSAPNPPVQPLPPVDLSPSPVKVWSTKCKIEKWEWVSAEWEGKRAAIPWQDSRRSGECCISSLGRTP